MQPSVRFSTNSLCVCVYMCVYDIVINYTTSNYTKRVIINLDCAWYNKSTQTRILAI